MWRRRRTFRTIRLRIFETAAAIRRNCGPIVVDTNQKTLPLGREGSQMAFRLSAHDVCRLEAFGAFEQIKLHGLSLVERAVAVLLNGGEMHEDILSRGALDEPISFRPVEPLDRSFLSHGKTPFPLSLLICSPES